jgi:hypothetical protein
LPRIQVFGNSPSKSGQHASLNKTQVTKTSLLQRQLPNTPHLRKIPFGKTIFRYRWTINIRPDRRWLSFSLVNHAEYPTIVIDKNKTLYYQYPKCILFLLRAVRKTLAAILRGDRRHAKEFSVARTR